MREALTVLLLSVVLPHSGHNSFGWLHCAAGNSAERGHSK